MISALYNIEFSVKRQVSISGGRLSQYQVQSTGNIGLIRPGGSQSTLAKARIYGNADFAKERVLFCPTTVDIQPADQITVGTKDYGVISATDFDDIFGNDSHKQVTISEK